MKIYYTNVTSTSSSSSLILLVHIYVCVCVCDMRIYVYIDTVIYLKVYFSFNMTAARMTLVFGYSVFTVHVLCVHSVCVCLLEEKKVFIAGFCLSLSVSHLLLFFNYTSIISHNCHANSVFNSKWISHDERRIWWWKKNIYLIQVECVCVCGAVFPPPELSHIFICVCVLTHPNVIDE